MTGISSATACRSSVSNGAFQESGSFALIGPPIMPMPAKARASSGTVSP